MEYDEILLRMGELFLKGRNRHRFIDRLYETTRGKLKAFEGVEFVPHCSEFCFPLLVFLSQLAELPPPIEQLLSLLN